MAILKGGQKPAAGVSRYGLGDYAIRSDGCEASPSCFTCPLPDCVWEPTAVARSKRNDRPELRAKIWADATAGMRLTQIAARASHFLGRNISPSVVSRIIREERAAHARG